MDLAYRSSLLRRIRAVHSLYDNACATMSVEQVNCVSHPRALPIAFSLVHHALIEDAALVFIGGPAPQFDERLAAKIGVAISNSGKELTVEEMMGQRIEDLDEFRTFLSLVYTATEDYVAGVDPVSLSEIVVRPPFGPTLENTFSARVAGAAGLSRSDAIECWVYQHALRHLGEIEHARSLVGLGGLTS